MHDLDTIHRLRCKFLQVSCVYTAKIKSDATISLQSGNCFKYLFKTILVIFARTK